MLRRMLILFAILAIGSTAMAVTADVLQGDEPVLRLRFQDKLDTPTLNPVLRPRLNAPSDASIEEPAAPLVSVADAGRVGTFAFVSTPHPNLVFAVGSMEDRREIGRQMDRALIGATREHQLYDHRYDSAPFIGLGVRSNPNLAGWSVDATIGAGFSRGSDSTRILNLYAAGDREKFETEARTNLRLKYTF